MKQNAFVVSLILTCMYILALVGITFFYHPTTTITYGECVSNPSSILCQQILIGTTQSKDIITVNNNLSMVRVYVVVSCVFVILYVIIMDSMIVPYLARTNKTYAGALLIFSALQLLFACLLLGFFLFNYS